MFCLRKTGQIISKIPAVEGISIPSPLIHFVRGIKPRWLPKAKSKIFYVRKPTPVDPEENAELRTAYFHYRTHIRAIRKFLVDERLASVKTKHEQSAAVRRDHAAELLQMVDMNSQWNSRVTSAREAAWLEEKEKQDAKTKQWMDRDQAKRAKRQAKAQERLQRNLKAAEAFISLENLDTEIEQLLNVRQDYDFAIDKQGNKMSDDSEVDSPKSSSSAQ